MQQAPAEESDKNYFEIVNEASAIPIGKGVKQGDPLSLKLFTTSRDMLFRKLNWEGDVSVTNGRLNHLCFANDVIHNVNYAREMNKMLQELMYEVRK